MKQNNQEQVPLLQLVVSALKIALLSFGGGVSALPVIYDEYVARRKWFDDETFQYFVTASNALPGPIISQLLVMIGYNKRGRIGAGVSFLVIGFTGPILLILLLTFLYKFVPLAIVERISQAVIPAVLALLASFLWQQYHKAQKMLGWQRNWGLLGVAFFAFFILEWNIAIIFISVILVILVITPNQKRGESS
ncbi:MAG: chromate transporter [Culicoidibacterales bacterium]